MISKEMGKKPLVLLLLIFIIPALLSWVMFHYPEEFSFKTLNHGVLINPPIAAPFLQHGQVWQIEVMNKEHLPIIYQLQKALGKDASRVKIISDFTKDDLEKLATLLSKDNKPAFSVNDKIFLLDPNGNLFMYYGDNVNAMYILKDLKRVLQVSQIG